MKIYQVGGCVRDYLLGLPAKDTDYVVVGSTPERMLALGYQQVGAAFPVFLHPETGEEYALARAERKVAPGYLGFEVNFDPSVTLEQDLLRRDLTINAMAFDPDTGIVIDPYNGRADLEAKVLRHTSEAFAEDPVRVLRTARFAARFGFTIAQETIDLMEKVVHELTHVPQERIWAEIEKGLMETEPARMFRVLLDVGADKIEAMKPYRKPDLLKLLNVKDQHDLPVRFALVAAGFMDDDFERCRIPSDCADLAKAFNRHFNDFHHYGMFSTKQALDVLYELRAFSRPWLLEKCLEVMDFYPLDVQATMIREDFAAAKSVDAAAIAASCTNGKEIKEKIFQARLAIM